MADSSFCTSVYTGAGQKYHRCVKVYWNSSNNAANNTSTINWSAYIQYGQNDDVGKVSSATAHYPGVFIYAKQIQITINGETITLVGDTAIQTKEGQRLGGGNILVAHNPDGSKTVSVSARAQFYTYGSDNATYSGSIIMKNNPVFNLTSGTVTGGSIAINRTSINGVNKPNTNATGVINDGTGVLCKGDKLKITASPSSGYALSSIIVNNNSFSSGSTHTVSGSVTVNASFRALNSSVSATDAIIETSPSVISFSKGAGTHVTLQISFPARSGSSAGTLTKYLNSSGNMQESAAYISSSQVSFTPTDAFYSRIPNNTSGTCTVYLDSYTYNNGVYTQTSETQKFCEFTVCTSEEECKPTIIVGNNNTRIDPATPTKNESVTCYISAMAANSASISKKYVNNYLISGNSYTFSSASADEYVFKVIDSRGYTATHTITPSYSTYVPLTCNVSMKRTSNTQAELFANGVIDVNRYNNLTIQYRYRKLTEANEWTSWTSINSGVAFPTDHKSYSIPDGHTVSSLVAGNDYYFEVKAFDGKTTVTKSIVVSQPLPTFDWGQSDFKINVDLNVVGDTSVGGSLNIGNDLNVTGDIKYNNVSILTDRESTSNKVTTINNSSPSSSKYPTENAVVNYVKGNGWTEITSYASNDVSKPTGNTEKDLGHNGAGVFYRVVGGNHVYISANVAVTNISQPTGEKAICNIPSEIRPTKTPYSICASGNGVLIARSHVSPSNGNLYLDWVRNLYDPQVGQPQSINWCDIYIDYYI